MVIHFWNGKKIKASTLEIGGDTICWDGCRFAPVNDVKIITED